MELAVADAVRSTSIVVLSRSPNQTDVKAGESVSNFAKLRLYEPLKFMSGGEQFMRLAGGLFGLASLVRRMVCYHGGKIAKRQPLIKQRYLKANPSHILQLFVTRAPSWLLKKAKI